VVRNSPRGGVVVQAESSGRVQRLLAARVVHPGQAGRGTTVGRRHRQALTALALTHDDAQAFAASKDGMVVQCERPGVAPLVRLTVLVGPQGCPPAAMLQLIPPLITCLALAAPRPMPSCSRTSVSRLCPVACLSGPAAGLC
jgi:hypothetical protein